jgi:hypothetical protein
VQLDVQVRRGWIQLGTLHCSADREVVARADTPPAVKQAECALSALTSQPLPPPALALTLPPRPLAS